MRGYKDRFQLYHHIPEAPVLQLRVDISSHTATRVGDTSCDILETKNKFNDNHCFTALVYNENIV